MKLRAKKFLITWKLQQDFLQAVEKENVAGFLTTNPKVFKLLNKLKKVKITKKPNRNASFQPIFNPFCKFLCDNMMELIADPKRILGHNSDNYEAMFAQRLSDATAGNSWEEFFEHYEAVFDAIILRARHKKVFSIKIEREDGKTYTTLRNARRKVNGEQKAKKSESLLNCFRKNRSRSPSPAPLPPALKENNIEQVQNVPPVSNVPRQRDQPKKFDKEAEQSAQFDREALRKYSNSLKTYDETSTFTEYKEPSIRHVPDTSRSPSPPPQPKVDWNARLRETEEHGQEQLKRQHDIQQQKLKALREERERITREAEEQNRKIREESAQRMRFFLQCVALKSRWDEQEKEWERWLKTSRGTILRLKTRWLIFGNKSLSMIRREFNENEIKVELWDVESCAQLAHNTMTEDFETLTALSQKYEDKLFLRVLQKVIREMAEKLCVLIEALDEFQNNEDSLESIKTSESRIYPWDIPTTTALRKVCETAREEDYSYVTPPRHPRRRKCVVTEV